MEDRLSTLLVIDFQKGFSNSNANKIVRPLFDLVKGKRFDFIIQTMWFNSGINNFTELLNYEECKIDGKDAGLVKLLPKAHVFPRVNAYSCLTPDLQAVLKYNMDIYVCGWESDACVLGTAFQLFDLGFKFNILEDCTASKNAELEQSAKMIVNRQFGKSTFMQSTDLYEKKKKLLGLF